MRAFYRRIVHWLAREEGQDLMEYGLLAFLISAALIAVISLIAPYVRSMFSRIVSALPPY